MKKTKKILIIVQTLSSGGVERVAVNIANNLNIGEIKVVLYENKIEYKCNKEIFVLNSPAGKNYLDKVLKFIQRIIRIRKIKKKENPSITLSMADGPNLVNLLSRKKDKIVISVHNTKTKIKGEKWLAKKIYHSLYNLFYKKADLIICVSEGVRNDLVKNFNVPEEKTKVIYNPIDVNQIQIKSSESIEHKWQVIFENPTIVNMGRLIQQKGQWHLIRAFNRVKQNHPKAKLVFLGEGELKDYLTNLAKNLGLKVYSFSDEDYKIKEADVFFLGFTNNPFKFMSNSDIFAFPSLWEGFSMAAVEALACGLPVVAADCNSGPRELLAPETDINRKAKKPEFGKYGIIMPMCDGNMYEADNPLTNNETKWFEILDILLSDESLKSKYSSLSVGRSQDFSTPQIIKEWKKHLL